MVVKSLLLKLKDNKVPMTMHNSIIIKHNTVRQQVPMKVSKDKINVDYAIGVIKKTKKGLKR